MKSQGRWSVGIVTGSLKVCPVEEAPPACLALSWGGLLACCAGRMLGLPQASAGEA